MSESCGIFAPINFLDPSTQKNPNMTVEILREGIDEKYPPIPDNVNNYLKNIYENLNSKRPEEIYNRALRCYPVLFIGNNSILSKPPPEEIIDKLIQLAGKNKFECIRYEASLNLYVIFKYFPMTRTYLIQQEFYPYLFNHLNNITHTYFVDVIKIDQTILEELAKIDCVKMIFNSIKDWENITKITIDPNEIPYPPLDPLRLKHPTPHSVLASNIYVFRQFLKYNIYDATSVCGELTEFLFSILNLSDENFDSDLKLAILKFFKTSIQFSWEFLQKNNFFTEILENCVNEKIFTLQQCSTCLKILKNSVPFCCDYLFDNGIISTIHSVFSRNADSESYDIPRSLFKDPKFCAIDLCTEIAKIGPEKMLLLIAGPGYGLLEDFQFFSNSGSYPSKISFMKFLLVIIKFANIPEISNFLASVSCIQFFEEFLESNEKIFFIDIIESLLNLIILTKKDALSKDLIDQILEVFNNSIILDTINDIITSNEIVIEDNPDKNKEFCQSLEEVAQQLLKEWSEISGQEE